MLTATPRNLTDDAMPAYRTDADGRLFIDGEPTGRLVQPSKAALAWARAAIAHRKEHPYEGHYYEARHLGDGRYGVFRVGADEPEGVYGRDVAVSTARAADRVVHAASSTDQKGG